ncbi:unnamed protein product [Hydatigera taeniaeformis]|uniref:Cytochrome c oxidase assembly protein COX16 homolog, mitochondrial n=1 Tax=Hydatigena taeniaeformis TaxID=6205 RepID=A0A0R3WMD5_HYDTA|nr:unnamed protein product [Hydatigera taeniaeformis]
MPGHSRAYRLSFSYRIRDITFKSFVLASCLGGIGLTGYIFYKLGSHYLFGNKTYKLQRKEYAEALLEKEKREKELGLRD